MSQVGLELIGISPFSAAQKCYFCRHKGSFTGPSYSVKGIEMYIVVLKSRVKEEQVCVWNKAER